MVLSAAFGRMGITRGPARGPGAPGVPQVAGGQGRAGASAAASTLQPLEVAGRWFGLLTIGLSGRSEDVGLSRFECRGGNGQRSMGPLTTGP
jgi:hypothetical protein